MSYRTVLFWALNVAVQRATEHFDKSSVGR